MLAAAFFVPAMGSRFYTFLANDVVIWALFATSLNLLVGYTGLVSFGHAAYFGIGAYATGHPHEEARACSFLLAFPAAGVIAGLCALVFGFFCVRLTRIYFAMLTLAFAQIVWAICFKWNEVTGGEQGMPEIPYPDFDWVERVAAVAALRWAATAPPTTSTSSCLVLVAACLWMLRRIVASPFGRMLTTIRENAERAEFIGVNVRRYELAAFVLAGAFAGLAGGLFGIFNRGVFPDFAYWTKSSEVLIMTLLGGMGTFFGPARGRGGRSSGSTSRSCPTPSTGRSSSARILVVLLFVFPGGIAGAVDRLWRRLARRPAGA